MGFIVGVGGHVFDKGSVITATFEPHKNGECRSGPLGTGLFHHHTAQSYGWHHYMLLRWAYMKAI
jgi:hypothetical protein